MYIDCSFKRRRFFWPNFFNNLWLKTKGSKILTILYNTQFILFHNLLFHNLVEKTSNSGKKNYCILYLISVLLYLYFRIFLWLQLISLLHAVYHLYELGGNIETWYILEILPKID